MKLSKADNKLDPTSETNLNCFSEDERSHIEGIVQRAEAEDKLDSLRIKYVIRDHTIITQTSHSSHIQF